MKHAYFENRMYHPSKLCTWKVTCEQIFHKLYKYNHMYIAVTL